MDSPDEVPDRSLSPSSEIASMPIIDHVMAVRSALKKKPADTSPVSTATKRISFNPIDSNGTPVRFPASEPFAPVPAADAASDTVMLEDDHNHFCFSTPSADSRSVTPVSHEYFTGEEMKQMSERATGVLAGSIPVKIRPSCYQVWMTPETKSRVIDCKFFKDDLMDFQDLNGKVRRILLSQEAFYSIQTAVRRLSLVFWAPDQLLNNHLPAPASISPSKKSARQVKAAASAIESVISEADGSADQLTSCESSSPGKENILTHWDHFRAFWITMLGYELKSAFRRDLDQVLIQAVSSMKKKMLATMTGKPVDLTAADSHDCRGEKRKRDDVPVDGTSDTKTEKGRQSDELQRPNASSTPARRHRTARRTVRLLPREACASSNK